jgi:peptidyl-prolyl cis-trans isomerase B (cyclophilin B)
VFFGFIPLRFLISLRAKSFLRNPKNLRVTLRRVRGKVRSSIMKKLILTCMLGLSLGLISACADDAKTDTAKPADIKPTEKKADSSKEVAVIKTSAGTMVIEFWTDAAPKTIANFKKLANSGFYDGTAFHRVIKGFMIQGGDPLTKDPSKEEAWGTGGPGYSVDAEFNDHSHDRGVISMARSNDPNSAGSQFFICHSDPAHGAPHFLDHQYTTFGKLIKGDDVLEKIATTPTHPQDRPDTKQVIESIKIVPADSIK